MRRARVISVLLLLACVTAYAGTAARAATSTTVVSVTVPSASWLDTTGCATGTPNVTSFGTVLPDTKAVTSLDCAVKFGSSNDTATIRTYQQDGVGKAMARSTAGQLDPTFGTLGVRTQSLSATNGDHITATVVQPDGKLVAAGKANGDMAIARYKTDGTLDTGNFGGANGFVTLDVVGTDEFFFDVLLEPDGQIVAVGHTGAVDFVVARFNANGTLDTTGFAAPNGYATLDTGGIEKAYAVALGQDGSIVVGGGKDSADFLLTRYTSAGTLDTSGFGAPNGYVVHDQGGEMQKVQDLEVLPDGSIVFVGRGDGDGGGGALHPILGKVTTTGTLDGGFGTGGWAYSTLGGAGSAIGTDLFLQADGKLLVAGAATADTLSVLWRVSSTGVDDATFGPGGYRTFDVAGTEQLSSVYQDADGRIIAGGLADAGAGKRPLVMRLSSTGAFDTTFSGDGWDVVSTGGDVTDPVTEYAYDVTPWNDGTILWTGKRESGGANDDHLLVRYDNVTVSDYDDLVANDDWATAGKNLFGACLRSVANGAVSGGTGWAEAPANTCDMNDGTHWHGIPAASPGSKIASIAAPDAQGGATDPTINLRFGFRTKLDQPPGTYLAPVTFEVVAPAY